MARQRKTQGPRLRQPFCLLRTSATLRRSRPIQLVPLIQLKCKGQGALRKQHARKGLQIVFVQLWGGQGRTWLPSPGFVTACSRGWPCPSWKPGSPQSGTDPTGCSRRGGSLHHPLRSGKPPSTDPASATTLRRTLAHGVDWHLLLRSPPNFPALSVYAHRCSKVTALRRYALCTT